MLLLFLFIKFFFLHISYSLNCIGGPNCHIKLDFNQKIPSHKKFLETCSIIKVSLCSVFLKIDYDNQQVDISFEKVSNHTQSPYHYFNLLTTNHQASIILRYTIEVKVYHNNKIQLYVLLQCQTHDQCTERELRHFWSRFISLNNRRYSFIRFYNFLFLNTSNFIDCFDDQTNQTLQCSMFNNNKCWASTDSQRKCINYDKNYPNYFIYSYNKVYQPHRLTDEHVYYKLACHVNNCNNNETIKQLSELARQFAENSRLMNNYNAIIFPYIGYHGTIIHVVRTILVDGLIVSRTVMDSGVRISSPSNHISRGSLAFDVSDFTSAVFLCPNVYYSSDAVYTILFEKDDDIVQVVLECSVKHNG
ncbi:unnamed protein product [Rotaria sordida]|uniref:ZP domain-containing protein n=1 Tax=Rotaria sordida TaxID=392033 RepID=A0A819H7H1_9BILA|nr:unnamed protein product [Rotaria sordida]